MSKTDVPNYKTKPVAVFAYQYTGGNPIPYWLSRLCHATQRNVANAGIVLNTFVHGDVKVAPNQWVVYIPDPQPDGRNHRLGASEFEASLNVYDADQFEFVYEAL